jgi:Fe-S oxidoreductase
VQQARAEKHGLTRFERSAAYLPHAAFRMRRWRHLLNLRDVLPWAAGLSEKLTGFSADRPWPHWDDKPFAASTPIGPENGTEILLFLDTFNNHFDAGTLRAAVDVLAASGFRVIPFLPPDNERPYCCGRTFLEAGLVDEARKEAERFVTAAAPFVARGVQMIGLEPSCLLTIRDEFPNMLDIPGGRELAAKSMLFEEVMTRQPVIKAIKSHLQQIEAKAICFDHCHQNAHGAVSTKAVAELVSGLQIEEGAHVCCGMGTFFGYDPKTVSLSLQMGEASLFPKIRNADNDTLLVADGFACRTQILHGTGRTARHAAVLLKLALAAKEQSSEVLEESEKEDAPSRRLARLLQHYFK